MNKTQRGFAALEGLLILVIITVVGAIGWYAIHTKRQTDKILSQADKISQSTSSNSETAFYNCAQRDNYGTKLGARLDDTLKILTCDPLYGKKYTHSALAPVKTVSQQSSTIADWHSAPDNLKNAIASFAPEQSCTSSKSVIVDGNFAVFDYGCDGGDIKLFMMNPSKWEVLSNWINNYSCDLIQKNQIPIELTQYHVDNSKSVAVCVDSNNIERQVIAR